MPPVRTLLSDVTMKPDARRPRAPPRPHRGAVLLGPALVVCLAAPLRAQELAHRLLDAEDGLSPPAVRSLAQDPTGFLWIGTEGGLFRYDGVEMRRWSPDSLDRAVVDVAAARDGRLVALRLGGALFAITTEGAERPSGPRGPPIQDARDVEFDGRGRLWVIAGGRLWMSAGDGRWARPEIALGADEIPWLVRRHLDASVHLVTNRGVWRVGDGDPRRILARRIDPVDILTTRDGRVLLLTFLGEVLEVTAEGAREVFRTSRVGAGGRASAMVERQGTLWISIDRYLVGWRGGENAVVFGRDEGVENGGPLVLDHEGSLWMGSFVGAYHFPEPETLLWTERSGLPSSHVRYLARAGDALWITTWYGAAALRRTRDGWSISRIRGWIPSPPHVDSRGTLWAGTERGLLEARPGSSVRRHLAGRVALLSVHETPEGELWLGTSQGLLRLAPGRASLERLDDPFEGEPPSTVDAVLVDRGGLLWATSGETVCRAPAARVREGAERGAWHCERIHGAVHVSGGGMIEMPSGALWVSSNRLGVLRRAAGGWEPVPGLRELPSRSILSLVPSRAGGVWVVGHGVLHRVTEAVGDSLGWRVEERLAAWHGLPDAGGSHVLEEPDGTVWVTTSRGVARVPASARLREPAPPRVVLVDGLVDNEPVSLRRAVALPHDRNRLELRFAALTFRDPSLVRYQVRLSPDAPWVSTRGAPSFRWVALPAGTYRAEVRASLDGKRWSPVPASFAFTVAPPWYRAPWATALALVLAALLLYAAHRLRLAHLLGLERQRTRIAMDLHDEVGSGLGSIGILSGMLASDGVDSAESRRMAREISATTGELGAALSQIVWSLDPRARTMEEVAGRLAELGRRLFASADAAFSTRFLEAWPDARPPELVRRNVLLIGLEALHNAARHARARNVELALAPLGEGRWKLEVTDDGIGLAGEPDRGEGMGLRSMRRRATEMRAELRWSAREGGGTAVTLLFRSPASFWRRPGRGRRAAVAAGPSGSGGPDAPSHDHAIDRKEAAAHNAEASRRP